MPCWPAANHWHREPGLVVVLYGDCPLLAPATLTELVDRHRPPSAAAATLITTRLDDPTGYGRIIFGRAPGQVRAIVEHKDATPEQLAHSASSTPAFIASAPICCGSTCSRSARTIRLTNTT